MEFFILGDLPSSLVSSKFFKPIKKGIGLSNCEIAVIVRPPAPEKYSYRLGR